MKRIFLCVLPLVFSLWAGTAKAQEALRIAAVVNDEVISVYDLNMRMSLVILFGGFPDILKTRQRLAPRVLDALIDEELKLQEASRLKVFVSEGEIERAISRLERLNGLEAGGLATVMSRERIKKKTLSNQIEADLGWRKLINARFGRTTQISEEEIDKVLGEIEKNKGKPEHLVSEIFLPFDQQKSEGETLDLANRLVQQIESGANFAALAQNFSKNSTAGRGGDLGWNMLGQLGGNLDAALVNLQPGQASPPIRALDGYYLLLLRDRRKARGLAGANAPSSIVNLQQLFLPLPENASPAAIADAMEGAKIFGTKMKNCQDMERMGKDIGSPLSGNLGDIKISSLGAQQRILLRGLPPLKASPPLRTADGVIVLMVCRRQESQQPVQDIEDQRNRIYTRLLDERLNLAARQHLRDLHRNAFVDKRL
ncbi:MAG: peptidylprolyl isomerase [Proteobacteria bacterium]|nr:peptidylprolyl isomerase [Pseudomonadota bacterium]